MALSQIYTAVAGHVITAARWNNEFGNIYANGTDVAFPLTKAVSLAGFTLTLDAAGATTLSSTASQGFIVSPGTKSGTPSVNGSFFNVAAATFTDTNTGASGTAALWAGATFRAPTLAATNTVVTTTDAATVHIEAGPTAGTNQTLTNAWALSTGGDVKVGGDLVVRKTDSSRTVTVDTPLIVESVTTGTPAAGIGTGILVRAESQDENPSDVGQLDFTFSDRTTASEDSYFQILLRVAGAALVASYRFVATSAFRSILTHANTADRTYTLLDTNWNVGLGTDFAGPSSTGAGSTIAHEGVVTISANQALQRTHFYTDFTLNASTTITLDAASQYLMIVASKSITINGTITATGKGSAGGLGVINTNGLAGAVGASQPGGAGGNSAGGGAGAGADGGAVLVHGVTVLAGGVNPGGAGTQVAQLVRDLVAGGGGGGGGGNRSGDGSSGNNGGAGGGSVILIAPKITLGASSVINTAGVAGSNGSVQGGGGGGGGAGNVIINTCLYTDSGCTFTLTGGAGGSPAGAGVAGGAGAAGVKQINLYA